MPVDRFSSVIDASPEEVFAWHERPGAFERLSPPWAEVRVLEREGGIRDGARVVLEVRKGPVHLTGEIRHRGFEPGRQFQDEQVRGPFASYLHTHRFLPAEGGRCLVEDEVLWEPPVRPALELFTGPVIHRELSRLFAFRHQRLSNDLELHGRYRAKPRLTVAISGASGFVGTALRHFLTSGGHHVLPMVRRRDEVRDGSVYWSWRKREVDRGALEKADAVVHLAGEPLIGLRWTTEKKREISESRVKGTELIARTMAELHSGPGALLSASGTWLYGDRGDEILSEESPAGRGFLADVCKAWEEATARAERSGVRVVRLRTGTPLSPSGGALGGLLLPFQLGLGGRLGSGRQYLPWIDLDDEVGIIYHALMEGDRVRGALNLTAPHPVPQATFATAMGRVLGRPTVLPVPGLAVRALLGEMGEQLLLSGQRARPQRTLDVGYRFLYEDVEASLRYQLGRPAARGGAG
jgi:uncharacterized protein (TIGR01777 family)